MKLIRGWYGEKKTTFGMWLSLDSKVYRKFDDVILPSGNGTTQIDHLLVSQFGLFIVETKNLKGWIFGSESQAKWTQTLYKKKYTFQNPLRQAFRQKKVLAEFLDINESVVRTVVYFVGDCKLKTEFPPNVLKSGLGRYIKQYRDTVLALEDVNRITEVLTQHRSESSLTRRDHVRSLQKRHTSNTVCPRCGSRLVKRVAKTGPHAGAKFLGCGGYPRCRFTKIL